MSKKRTEIDFSIDLKRERETYIKNKQCINFIERTWKKTYTFFGSVLLLLLKERNSSKKYFLNCIVYKEIIKYSIIKALRLY